MHIKSQGNVLGVGNFVSFIDRQQNFGNFISLTDRKQNLEAWLTDNRTLWFHETASSELIYVVFSSWHHIPETKSTLNYVLQIILLKIKDRKEFNLIYH